MKVLLEYVQVESIYRNFELRNQDVFFRVDFSGLPYFVVFSLLVAH